MAIQNYGVLTGTIIDKLDSPSALQKNPGSKPHYQILVEANDVKHRIAVNVKSNQRPSDLQVYMDDNFSHPILEHIKDLPVGFSNLPNIPNTAALDYIRGNLFNINDMRIVPTLLGGPNNDLNDIFDLHIRHAMDTSASLIYAFGSKWGPENDKKDEYFDFLPGNGIHNIHMNQGNVGSHANENGIYQDGGLLIFYPNEQRWVAMFLKFQSQFLHTDDTNADPIDSPLGEPGVSEVENTVQIFAAMVDPKADDVGKETVYLLNVTSNDVNLDGWMIADKLKKKDIIRNIVLKAGDVTRIILTGQGAQLSNNGGIITLLNENGLKIYGVSYTKQNAGRQGVVTTF